MCPRGADLPCPESEHSCCCPPYRRGRCGTAGTTVRPRPDIDLRPPGPLNASERLTTPYAWLTSPACRDQARAWAAGRGPPLTGHSSTPVARALCQWHPVAPAPQPSACHVLVFAFIPQVKSFYSAVVNRKNTLTGVLYRDDPTIFSWVGGACSVWDKGQRQAQHRPARFVCTRTPNLTSAAPYCVQTCCSAVRLRCFAGRRHSCAGIAQPPPSLICPLQNLMNEPRCKYCGPEAVDGWYGELSAHLKVSGPGWGPFPTALPLCSEVCTHATSSTSSISPRTLGAQTGSPQMDHFSQVALLVMRAPHPSPCLPLPQERATGGAPGTLAGCPQPSGQPACTPFACCPHTTRLLGPPFPTPLPNPLPELSQLTPTTW